VVSYLRIVEDSSSCTRREVEPAQDSTLCLPRTILQDYRYPPIRRRARHYRDPTVTCRSVHQYNLYFVCILIHHSTIRRRSRRPRSSPLRGPRYIGCERRVERSQAPVQDLDSGRDVRIPSCFRLALWGASSERYGQFNSCSRPFASVTVVSFMVTETTQLTSTATFTGLRLRLLLMQLTHSWLQS
jgi:hypothetical protein